MERRDSCNGTSPGMEPTKYPSPDNPQRAPVWENYIVAQATESRSAELKVAEPYPAASRFAAQSAGMGR